MLTTVLGTTFLRFNYVEAEATSCNSMVTMANPAIYIAMRDK